MPISQTFLNDSKNMVYEFLKLKFIKNNLKAKTTC